MIQAKPSSASHPKDPYLEQFQNLARVGVENPPWLAEKRQASISRYGATGLPTLKDEDWRFTNVAPMARLPFAPFEQFAPGEVRAESIRHLTFSQLPGPRLVFVNGHFSAELSSLPPLPSDVRIGSLADALRDDSPLLRAHLAHHLSFENNPFASLNTAFFHDGAFIFVPAGRVLQEPVQLLFISAAAHSRTHSHPRNLIVAGKGSQLTVLESYVSFGSHRSCTNTATELVIEEGAMVEHCKFQDENLDSFHCAALHVHLDRGSDFIHHSIAAGARLARNNIRTHLAGEGVNCILNGLYLAKGDQLVDHHMVVEHARPHCQSHEYFNGILDGRSRGVFHGRILVRPEAQKTDAKQTNKNLLLSDDATIDTKPQLEIYADDVKCTHGATIGQLNEESIFYLRARGIGLETARRMLIHSFAGEIIERIRYQPARDELDKLIWERLEQNPHIAEPR